LNNNLEGFFQGVENVAIIPDDVLAEGERDKVIQNPESPPDYQSPNSVPFSSELGRSYHQRKPKGAYRKMNDGLTAPTSLYLVV